MHHSFRKLRGNGSFKKGRKKPHLFPPPFSTVLSASAQSPAPSLLQPSVFPKAVLLTPSPHARRLYKPLPY